MKLAVIDHSGYLKDVFKHVPLNGLELSCSNTLEEFEKEHGNLKSYDGLMLHPGRANARSTIEKLHNSFPGLKYCVVSLNQDSYHNDGETTVIPATDTAGLLKFFGYLDQK
jgi:hypothetical protein